MTTGYCQRDTMSTGYCQLDTISTGYCQQDTMSTVYCQLDTISTGYCQQDTMSRILSAGYYEYRILSSDCNNCIITSVHKLCPPERSHSINHHHFFPSLYSKDYQ